MIDAFSKLFRQSSCELGWMSVEVCSTLEVLMPRGLKEQSSDKYHHSYRNTNTQLGGTGLKAERLKERIHAGHIIA